MENKIMTTLSEKKGRWLGCKKEDMFYVDDVRKAIKKLKEKLPNACIDALDNEYYPQNLIDEIFGEELTREEEQK